MAGETLDYSQVAENIKASPRRGNQHEDKLELTKTVLLRGS